MVKKVMPSAKQSFSAVAEVVQQLLAVAEELEAAGTPLGAGPTAKAWATQHILQRCIKRGEKLVIFCQYLTDLDNIEAALQQVVRIIIHCHTMSCYYCYASYHIV